MTGTTRLEVKLSQVLWRTRGRTWDYAFVLRPSKPQREQWYDAYRSIFSGLTPAAPGELTRTRHGVFGRSAYVATTFCDPQACDEAGRPIAHSVAWFPGYLPEALPADWGQQIVDAIADDLHRAAAPPDERRFAGEAVDLTGPAVALDPGTRLNIPHAPILRGARNIPTILLIGAIFATMTAALCNWLR